MAKSMAAWGHMYWRSSWWIYIKIPRQQEESHWAGLGLRFNKATHSNHSQVEPLPHDQAFKYRSLRGPFLFKLPQHPYTKKYAFFSEVHGTFSKIEQIRKKSQQTYEKFNHIILHDHKGIKLNIKNKKASESTQTQKLNNTSLVENWVNGETKEI